MTETEFATLSGLALEKIEHRLEACGADLDFELAAGGVLEIEFADGSKIIVNRHAVAQEIWVAAKSGGFHFRYDGSRWCDSRDGEELMDKLSRLATAQAAAPIVLS
ncbi:MAG: iron donor protein CyaY [Rhodocyclaceae bacterium]